MKWIVQNEVENVLPNANYIVRRLGTNETQLLHPNRQRKFTPQTPLADIFFRRTDWQKHDQMQVTHDDLYTQSCNTNYGPNPFDRNPQDYSQNTDKKDYVPIEVPGNNHSPVPEVSNNRGRWAVEQPTEPVGENTIEITQ